MRRGIATLALSLLLSCSAQSIFAFELKPFSVTYTADWTSVPVSGSAKRTLEHQSDGNWALNFDASMLVTNFNEQSTFKTEGNTLLPQYYLLKRTSFGRIKQIEYRFDWATKSIIGSDRGDAVKLPLNRGILDKSTYQVALQYDLAAGKRSMSYQIVDGDEIDTYDFRVLDEEAVQTRVGRVMAVKVERVRDPNHSKRQTILWLAKQWDYLLVQLQQIEKDGKEYKIVLEQGSLGGKELKGS